jgi:hypothetical protein
MGIIEIIVLVVVICLIIYLAQLLAPRLPAPWGTIVIVVVLVCLIIYLAVRFLGLQL